jgi:hypothetical protein
MNTKVMGDASQKYLLLKENGEKFIPGQAVSQERIRKTISDFAYGRLNREKPFWDQTKLYIPRKMLNTEKNKKGEGIKNKSKRKYKKNKSKRKYKKINK